VFPSSYEAAPLVAYEAAASGLPLVATAVNGVDELLEDGRAGVLVERSSDAIAAALRTLADDTETRLRMGAAARERAESHDWSRSADAVLELYGELVAAKGAGR
jgi:D-inositol-3-phosphate glycosyltransferase